MSASTERKSEVAESVKRKSEPDCAEQLEQSDTKKAKTAQSAGSHPTWETLTSFKFVKILRDDVQTKTLCIHAKTKLKSDNLASGDVGERELTGEGVEEADAVIVMEKTPFNTSQPGIDALISSGTSLKQVFNNDIYGTYQGLPPADLNSVKTVVIFPATAKHLEKYQTHEGDLIYESAEDYRSITLPYIQSSSFEMQWIYNILEKKKESEFIVYEDPDPINGFILLPDLKWDRKSVDNMYVSAIIHRHGVRSIRELTTEHLPLLKNIQKTALKAIELEYGVPSSRIRAYFHYQPSYYHLHVHFNLIKYTAPGSNVLGAHLLSDVIDNIEMMPDYYQRKTLAFVCKGNALLYQCYKNAGRLGSHLGSAASV